MTKHQLESRFTAWVTRVMKEHGAKILVIMGGGRGMESGWPDRLVWSRQWRGLLEFKGTKTKVKPEQTLVMRQLNQIKPGSAYVIRDPDDGSDEVLVQDETGTRTLLRTTPRRLVWDLAAMYRDSTFVEQEELE